MSRERCLTTSGWSGSVCRFYEHGKVQGYDSVLLDMSNSNFNVNLTPESLMHVTRTRIEAECRSTSRLWRHVRTFFQARFSAPKSFVPA
jgi:hypothetical protein